MHAQFWDFATAALPYVFGLARVVVILMLNKGTIQLKVLKIIDILHRRNDRP